MIVPAMMTNFGESDGSVGDSLVGYLAERARGGFGAIITENIGVHPGGRVMPRMVMADDDRYLPGLRRLAGAVRDAGGVLIGQISHAGRQTRRAITGQPLVAPSPIPCPLNREMPRELALDEIALLERAFVSAACRLSVAGFDGVEIHGAHGYLVGGFLSPYSNKRRDAYGGSLDNRLRFLRNILRGIRQRLGADFPLIVRISADEFVDGGLDVVQSIEVAQHLEAEGIHALSVSVGVYGSFNKVAMISGEPEGQWLGLAGRVRAGTRLPIIGVGRIKRPAVAEDGLAAGNIDIAAFGRASIADPLLPRRVAEGREEDIRWCLGCNVCLGRSARPQTICPVNPQVGREDVLSRAGAARPRTVVVHGSCLAALTAAWVAAARGHRVSVIEADGENGGMQAWRARVPGQEEHAEILAAARRRAAGASVRFVGAAAASPASDAVWRVRRFEPTDRRGLSATAGAVSSYDLLAGRVAVPPAGSRLAAVGDDLSVAEAALLAAARGVCVTLLPSSTAIACDAHPGYREVTRRKLHELGAEIIAGGDIPADADTVVIGHDPALSYASPEAWVAPAGLATAVIADAYEPGAFTAGVYDAFALALAFDGIAAKLA